MWVALLIVMLQTGEKQNAVSMYPSEAECKAGVAKIEPLVNEDDNVAAYAVKCVEFVKADVKRNGKQS